MQSHDAHNNESLQQFPWLIAEPWRQNNISIIPYYSQGKSQEIAQLVSVCFSALFVIKFKLPVVSF